MQAVSNYDLLISKIDTFIRRYYLNKLLRGIIFLGAVLFSGFVVVTLSEYLGNFNTLLRSILFFGYILLNVTIFCWLVLPPLMAYFRLGSTISHDEAAQIIGTHFADVKDKLLNTLQLKRLSDDQPAHRALIEASINQKIVSLKPVSFPSAIRIKENVKYLKWALVPLCIIVILAFTAPSMLKDSTERLIKHNQYFAPKSPFRFVITNPVLSVVQGEDFKLELKLVGDKFPNDVYLEAGNNTFKLDKDNIGKFHYLFSNLQQNVKFKLTGNDFSSEEYQISVNLKPSLLHFDVELQYPAYIHKKNEQLNNAGDLTLPIGTTVRWTMHTQNANAMLFEMNGHTKRLQADGNAFLNTERILNTANYSLKALNNAVKHGDSASYHINIIADQPPTIEVDEKPDSASSKAIYFNGKIQDDYGFSWLTFHYSITSHTNAKPRTFTKAVKADLNQNQTGFFYYWNLKELDAKPGEEVSYYFEVADNNGVNGPQTVRSAEHTLHIPTEQELNKQLDAGTESVKQKMASAIKLSAEVEKDAKKLNELLLNKNNLSFDEKKQVQDLLQKRKELDDMVKDIQKENKQNLLNRQENKKEDQEILDKQKQIENLFNNVLDEKTRDLLKRLEKLLEQNQKDPAQDELSKMQMDNKSLKKELDRMLELYKQLEIEQKLKENINQLNKLADKEKKLADETRKDNSDQKAIQQKQDELKKDFKDVEKSLDELKDKNDQLEQKTNFENPKADEKKINDQIDKSQDNLSKSNKQKASQSQQDAGEQMQQLAEKLQKMQQDGEQQQDTINMQQLRELIKNLVNNSFEQEKTMQSLRNMNAADPAYINWAQKQKDIKDNMKNAEDSLYSLSKRVPQIESTVNKEIGIINSNIEQSLTNLGDRRTAEANQNQQYAMTSMNNLALMLDEALSQLQNSMKNAKGGKGKSKQPSMSQLNQMQQKLNENMQKMRNQMQQQGNQGKSGSQGQMSEQFAKMAREQQMIRQSLQQINEQQNKDGKKQLGDLDNISKEMEQTEKDLVNKKISEETVKRQQQIKTRMLEAEKADQQRDQDQQRESKAAKDVAPGYVKALQNYQQMKSKQTEQIRTVSPTLNYYYKSKIKIYFDQINGK
ncbi:uncharacterized protein DUF4175 [Mucilaginibacter gracilis]|uniref:Uncharacterized protein DUF4175 n=1 Tax=Mucilaginibacter gracilis TaxID=423350 RepID=A0A495IY04_9SPHI|nr:DUF4175 family protein [Mucilaginibacter gracilis]RKR80958.1 uncharacterized protein DUF4175 [Mucilaginibacter gracilis]